MLVGHLPHLGKLASILLTGSESEESRRFPSGRRGLPATERRQDLADGLDGHARAFPVKRGIEMAAMTSRERVTLALNHQEPDRVPIDLGSIASTIRTVDAYDRLKNYLGLALDKKIRHFADEHIIPDEEILRALHVDTFYLRMNVPKNWQRVRLDKYTVVDEWEVPWYKAPGSFYTFPASHPMKTAGMEEVEKFPWPDPNEPSRFEGLREKARQLLNGPIMPSSPKEPRGWGSSTCPGTCGGWKIFFWT